MITVSDVSLKFSEKPLFKDVNLKFMKGNCYGIIGANGAGKSTFLNILSGEIEHDTGTITMTPGERMSVLSQDHFKFDEYSVKETVKMGYPKLYQLEKDIDAIYAKEDFSDEDGMKAAEMQGEFGELGGYEAENQIEQMLSGLGLEEEFHDRMMSDLDEGQKVRVLLAQSLFGNPDYLILDEPTNGLDLESITWLEDFLLEFENCVIVVSHDRHFLNAVCTYTCDIDYGKITQFTGNYDFWYQAVYPEVRIKRFKGRAGFFTQEDAGKDGTGRIACHKQKISLCWISAREGYWKLCSHCGKTQFSR